MEEKELLYEEHGTPEVVEHQEEQIPDEAQELAQEAKPTPQQSWKELRLKAERAEKLEKERDQYFNMLKQIEQEALKYQQQATADHSQPEEEFDYNNLPDDDLIEGKQLKKILSQEQKRRAQLEQTMKLQQKYTQEAAVEASLKTRYADFYDVVTPENIAALRDSEPDIAESLNLNPSLEKKAVGTYNAIKKLGIYQGSGDQYLQDKARAQQNASKPRPLNSIAPQSGGTPLDQANAFSGGLTKELKAKLYAEMREKAQSR